jgi:hypothetical protein
MASDVSALRETSRLRGLISEFLSWKDVSPAAVGEMEGIVIRHFVNTELGERLRVPLASYSPWGGDDPAHLYTAAQLRPLLVWADEFLRNSESNPENVNAADGV